MEGQIQKRLVKYLKSKGCYVIKTKPGVGVPVGCPDVIALHEGAWFAFEVKADSKSSFQPLQKETIERLAKWSFAYVIHSENYDKIVLELDSIFR